MGSAYFAGAAAVVKRKSRAILHSALRRQLISQLTPVIIDWHNHNHVAVMQGSIIILAVLVAHTRRTSPSAEYQVRRSFERLYLMACQTKDGLSYEELLELECPYTHEGT